MSDNYEKVCKERFNIMDGRLAIIEKSTGEMREKIFDGFGDSINHIEDKLKTVQTLLISVVILGGLSITIALIGVASRLL